jgi:dihydroorotase
MQHHDLILNIHGEQPGATPLKAEAEYTPVLRKIHAAFPRLRIVLEHISTREGLEMVRQCGPTVHHHPVPLMYGQP